MALGNNPTQLEVVKAIKDLENKPSDDTWRAIYVNGVKYKSNSISGGDLDFRNGDNVTAKIGAKGVTLGVASGYSIPSTTKQSEWDAKADTSDIPTNYVTTDTAQTISGAKTLSTDLTFNASVQTQLIYKTNGTTTGLIRSGISNVGKYMITQSDQHYWGSIANANRVIFDSVNKILHPETNGNIALGDNTRRWSQLYVGSNGVASTGSVVSDSYFEAARNATAWDGFSITNRGNNGATYNMGKTNGSTRYDIGCYKMNLKRTNSSSNKTVDWVSALSTCCEENSANIRTRLETRQATTDGGTTYKSTQLNLYASNNYSWVTVSANDLRPSGTSTDLGTSNNKWRNIYGVNVYATSDRRLKENIKDAELDCGAVIDDLPIREFNFKSDEEKKVVVGAIAQELQEILPEKYRATLVSGSEDTSYSINEGKLLYVAIGALKEERAKTKELEERLAKLEKMLGV